MDAGGCRVFEGDLASCGLGLANGRSDLELDVPGWMWLSPFVLTVPVGACLDWTSVNSLPETLCP